MRFLIGIAVLIGLTTWAFSSQNWGYTDIDRQFLYLNNHDQERYKTNCAKPPEFKGLRKFKVSCIVEHPWFFSDTYVSHRRLIHHFRSVEIPDLKKFGVKIRDNSPDIYTLERNQSEYPNCRRLVFMVIDHKDQKIIFADPQKLYCKSL